MTDAENSSRNVNKRRFYVAESNTVSRLVCISDSRIGSAFDSSIVCSLEPQAEVSVCGEIAVFKSDLRCRRPFGSHFNA